MNNKEGDRFKLVPYPFQFRRYQQIKAGEINEFTRCKIQKINDINFCVELFEFIVNKISYIYLAQYKCLKMHFFMQGAYYGYE